VSPGHQNTINPALESTEHILGVNPAGTWNPDDPDIGRLLQTVQACQIRSSVGAPVAAESHYFWFPVLILIQLY